MQSLKANPFNREQQDETPLNKTVAQGEATKTKETKYPEIWRTAFAIRENVRFTRTPDVAMPKRAEALEKALNEKAVDDSSDKILNGNEQKSSSASGTTQVGAQYGQKTASHTMQGAASLRPQATFGYPAIRNPLILNRAKVKTPETVPEVLEEVLEEAVEEVLDVDMIEEAIVPNADLSHILPFNEDDNPAVIDGLDDEVVEETEITVSKNPILISDFAFFECGPFTLNESDTLAEQANDNATMNHDIIAHDAALPEVGAQNAPVANQAVNEQQSIHEQTSQNISVSEMFKVLECRLSHANSSSVNHQESTPESVLEENTPEGTLETEPALNDEVLPFEEGDDADLTAPIFDNVSNDIETGDIETPNIETLNADDFDAIFGADDQSDEGNQADTEDDITALLEADDAQDNDQSQDEDDFDFIEAQDDVETVRAETKQVSPQPSNQASPQASGQPAKTVVIARPNLSDMSVKPMVKTVASGPYQFPSIDLLQPPVYQNGEVLTRDALERSAGLLESVLEDFGIKGEIIQVRPGPVVTLYEFEPAAGVKSSRVIALSDDIARSMSAISARVAVIPGRNVIGIELPNATRETVYLREIVQSHTFADSNYKLALALGKSINGEPVTAELAKMPHLLVAGTTGSGKSVAINTMILSLLYRLTPQQCRLIMVDPKMLELSVYDGIPHLLTPVVTDPKKAVVALKWAVREMEDRYRKMAKLGVRNIDGFNARVQDAREKGETINCTVQAGFDRDTGELLYREEEMDLNPLPYIVIVVDEMADLMMVAGKEIEGTIQRLAQMARAAGIHLIMATQRPSVDVITGTIKANFPTRISFSVTSKIDSRTILGEQGAETLLGMGDMLFMSGGGSISRVHGAFVSDTEVEEIVSFLKTQGSPDYLATVTDGEEDDAEDAGSVAEIIAAAAANGGDDGEELYLQAVKIVMRDKKCSTSYIQRRLNIGYNKAATLVERMEDEGLVGVANHVGKREILFNQHG